MGHWLREWVCEGHSEALTTLSHITWPLTVFMDGEVSSYAYVPTGNVVCFLIQSLV